MTKYLCIVILFTTVLPRVSFAQDLNKTKLDSLFTSLAANKQAMGSIAISKKGNLVYRKTIGYSQYSNEKKVLSSENSKFRIGSISKIFTATIIFQLIEEGKIDLATPLEKYFPDFPNSNEITISNLLNHRSGIRNMTKIASKTRPRTHEEMLTIIAETPFKYEPGTKSSYSNSNYLILGYIIEKVCNRPYEEVLLERIVSRIGLANTYYGHTTNVEKNECFPFRFKKDWEQQPQTDLSIPGASGAIVSTPGDLVVFIEALFSKKLINENSLTLMKTITNGYGMGLREFEFDKKKAYGYIGGIDRYESVLAYFPSDSLAIAYCANGRVYPTGSIVMGSLEICFNLSYSIPDFKSSSVNTGRLKKYTGIYTSSELPLTIKISRQKKNLVAEADGYSPYTLEAVGSDKFKSDEVSVAIEFDPPKNAMKLKRGDQSYYFYKCQ